MFFFFQKVWENDLFSMTERIICIQSTEWRKSFESDERKKERRDQKKEKKIKNKRK